MKLSKICETTNEGKAAAMLAAAASVGLGGIGAPGMPRTPEHPKSSKSITIKSEIPKPELKVKPKAKPESKTKPEPIKSEPKVKPEPKAKISDSMKELMDFIAHWEGKRNKKYLDSKSVPTIGIGFNLNKEGAREKIESLGLDFDRIYTGRIRMSDKDIYTLFESDVKQAIKDARIAVENFENLPRKVRFIVIDMAYNLGLTKFLKFKKTINHLNNNNFIRAAAEMKDSLWYRQTGRRSRHHVKTVKSYGKKY